MASHSEAPDFVPPIGPRVWLIVLACYFFLHAVLRVLVSPSVDLDEAEQIIFSQRLAWYYGASPPLYTWLQIGIFNVFGQSVLGLTLLKNLILFGLLSLTYWTARNITGRHSSGFVASICVLLTQQIVWESQRDLTHSVLACAMVVAWLGCLERVQRLGTIASYALLGVLSAAGVLSKFNFAFAVFATLIAALTTRTFRDVILNRRFLVTVIVSGALLGVWWLGYHHRGGGLGSAVDKLHIEAENYWLKLLATGVWRLLSGALASCLVPGLVLWALMKKKHGPFPTEKNSAWVQLFLRSWVVMFILAAAAIPIFKIHGFHQRWLQPLLMGFPIFAGVLADGRLREGAHRVLLALGIMVMMVVAIVLPGRTVFGWASMDAPLARPYPALAQSLREKLPLGAFVVTDTSVTGGNLRLALRDVTVFTPETSTLFGYPGPHCVAVWDSTKKNGMPKSLIAWAKARGATNEFQGQPHILRAVYPRMPTRQRLLAWTVLW